MGTGDGEQPEPFQGCGSAGGKGYVDRGGRVLQEAHGDGEEGRPSTPRHGLSIAHRVAMGICLPGGNDHGVLVGERHQFFSGEL